MTPTDKKENKEAKKSARQQAAAESSVLTQLLATPDGRRFVYLLFESAGHFSLGFSPDSRQHAYYQGGYDLLKPLQMQVMLNFPQQYDRMMKENANTDDPHGGTDDPDDTAGDAQLDLEPYLDF